MTHWVFDTETNEKDIALVDRIHSLVLKEYDTGEVVSCTDSAWKEANYTSIETGLRLLADANYMTAHNGIAYDYPVLHKLFPRWKPKGKKLDTVVLSRHLFAHRKEADFVFARKHPNFPKNMTGKHSLEAWGYRLGRPKLEFDGPWDRWSKTMQTYCEGDVETGYVILKFFKSLKRFDIGRSDCEHSLQTRLENATRAGLPMDVQKAQELWSVLQGDFDKISAETREAFGWWYQKDNTPAKDTIIVPVGDKQYKCKVFIPKKSDPYILPASSKRKSAHGSGYVAGAPSTRLKRVEFSATSRTHIRRVLENQGWQPEEFTDKGTPRVTEESLTGLKFPHIEKIQRILLLDKRISALSRGAKSWMKLVDEHGMLHPRISATGAITHRGKHSDPNISQAPKPKNPYGKEFRELIYAPRGWQVIGADVSGLELRCLAHDLFPYDDGQYMDWVLNGDVHAKHVEMIGGILDRDDMKTWFYAYLYGAGDQKLGRIIAPHKSVEEQKKIGRKYRRIFENNLAALGLLQKEIGRESNSGWIELIDGRPARVRSSHAALNTRLQGTGAIICKYWLVDACDWMEQEYGPDVGATVFENIPGKMWKNHGVWSMNIWAHDEGQFFVRAANTDAALIQKQLVQKITDQQERLGFRCPLTGEAKVGRNWAETH